MLYRISRAGAAVVLFTSLSLCQQASPSDPTQPSFTPETERGSASPPESKRILGVIPNYRTSPSLQNYEPLT
ncbi:MAG: hypothetical protein WBW33_33630, partial [Bryobacteraceae bacterium]